MKNHVSWSSIMNSHTETRTKIKAPTVVTLIVGLHVMAVGSIVLIQGCGTPRPEVDTPEKAVMPPKPEVREARPTPPPPRAPEPAVAPEPDAPRMPAMKTYEVRSGDNLSTIARRHGVTQTELMDLNNIQNPDLIVVGQELLLPPHAEVREREPRAERPRREAVADGKEYVVRPGDTLSHIAVRHGTTVSALREANNLRDDVIRVDQKLVIPGAEPARESEPAEPRDDTPEPAEQPEPGEPRAEAGQSDTRIASGDEPFPYTVQEGDTLESIAMDFAVLKDDILSFNDMAEGDRVRPGQRLMIPSTISH